MLLMGDRKPVKHLSTLISHNKAHELLHAYAHEILMGKPPEAHYPAVAAHLARCPVCRAELSGLLSETEAAARPAQQAQPHPGPDLSRLTWPEQPAGLADPPFVDSLRRLWVAFSQERLRGWQMPAVVGAMRGALLYAHGDEGVAQAADLRIQIYAESDPALVTVVVTVADAASDELEQSGTLVALYGDDLQQQARTDGTGTVHFAQVPRAALPRLRLAITLDRSA
jgi:hypothetical protein